MTTKKGSSATGVFVQRSGATGRFKSVVVPGKGSIPVVKEATVRSAKVAAGNRLRTALENTRRWDKRGESQT